ncbi:hypothetical protein AXX12_15505 [Anaerosporomusa subterranea]|uniref:Diguanylate cyclase n=1 Tax=Anaerosporomusa subterranea TaxID=1794912 RepID=A0A154BLY3_ANASB|nr:sensor domain-containing diguanylate cyclase [Anaerosporomusa subterranea]KYZ74984.1 hypothetical protein AXX12_15505 [Anaerosporomusa subterranea]
MITIRANTIEGSVTDTAPLWFGTNVGDAEKKICFQQIFEVAPVAMLICNLAGGCIWANSAFYELVGYAFSDNLALYSRDFVHPDDLETELQFIQALQKRSSPQRVNKVRYIRGDGRVIDVEQHATVLQDSNSGYIIMQVIDTTKQKQLETDMRFMAFHDALTGLGNRLQFQEKLAFALQQAEQEHTGMGIVFLDLDRFKLINDTIGHQAGDQALREIGRRLAGCVRKSDTVARVGGDEFIVLLPTISNRADARRIAEKMIIAIEKPLCLADCQFSLQASFGVAVFPDDGQDADSLIAAADLAMYRCKGR